VSPLEAYRQITAEVTGITTPPDPLKAAEEARAEVAKLRAEVAERDQAWRNQQLAQEVEYRKRSTVEFVNKAEGYKYTKAMGMQESAYWTMVKEYQKTGTVLTEKEAADIVEADLKADYEKLRAVENPAPPVVSAPVPHAAPSRTISNAVASAPAGRIPNKLNERQKFEYAAQMLERK
jgi:hypothetical protein